MTLHPVENLDEHRSCQLDGLQVEFIQAVEHRKGHFGAWPHGPTESVNDLEPEVTGNDEGTLVGDPGSETPLEIHCGRFIQQHGEHD
jgi:hypothetical protein